MDKQNNTTQYPLEGPITSRKGNRRSLSVFVLRQAGRPNSASTSVEPREKPDSLRVFLPISGRHLGPGWGKRAVAPISFESRDSQPLNPYQRHPTPEEGTGNQNGVGDGGNSIDNPVTLPEGCSPKGIKRARSASLRDGSKRHTRTGRRMDTFPHTNLPRSERILQVSVYDILQTRTYAHYRAQLDSLRAVSKTRGGAEQVFEHSDSPLSPHTSRCPGPRDSSDDLAKPGYRTQDMPNHDVDLQPASSRVENELSGPSQGHANAPFPASVNRLHTPSSREGSAAARAASPRSRPADSRITDRSHSGPKRRSKVWELRSDSSEPASETESEGGSDYAKQAWWVPEQVDQAERLTRARSTAETHGVPVPETQTLGRAIFPDSEETSSSYIGKSKDIMPYSLDLGTTEATSPILGRGPQGKNKPLLKPRLQQPGTPTGTVSGGASSRPKKSGSRDPLPRGKCHLRDFF